MQYLGITHLLNQLNWRLLNIVTSQSYIRLICVFTLKLLQYKMRTSAIVLAALLGTIAFAEPTLKQKLGQSKKLAQTRQGELDCDVEITASAEALEAFTVAEPDLSWCPCDDEILPGLGAGVQASNSLTAEVNQLTTISSTPDVSQSSECLTNCCACNEANGEQRINAQRVRHFCIAGDISVTEDIEFHELSHAQEASAGIAHKESLCVLNNQGSEDLGDICIENVSACPDGEGGGVGSGNPGSGSGSG